MPARRRLVSSNYAVLESIALVQSRHGMEAVRDLHDSIVPLLDVQWVGSELHELGMAMLLAAGRRRLSLVDCVSFAICRRLNITVALAFDPHFAEMGLPLPAW